MSHLMKGAISASLAVVATQALTGTPVEALRLDRDPELDPLLARQLDAAVRQIGVQSAVHGSLSVLSRIFEADGKSLEDLYRLAEPMPEDAARMAALNLGGGSIIGDNAFEFVTCHTNCHTNCYYNSAIPTPTKTPDDTSGPSCHSDCYTSPPIGDSWTPPAPTPGNPVIPGSLDKLRKSLGFDDAGGCYTNCHADCHSDSMA